jgi:hypothetical protein
MQGKGHWHWAGGEYTDAEGYVRIWTPEGHRMKHHVVMEKHLGRRLRPGEFVKHRDDDLQNNRLANLLLQRAKRRETGVRPRAARRSSRGVKRVARG